MAHHELKTWPIYFDAIERGEKFFEVRRNDRFFQAGDTVTLVRMMDEPPHHLRCFPHKEMTFLIGSILQGGQFGIEPKYCVFSLLPIPKDTDNGN